MLLNALLCLGWLGQLTHGGLRGHAAHAVDAGVNYICARLRSCNLGGHSSASRVMGVDMDGNVWELLPAGRGPRV